MKIKLTYEIEKDPLPTIPGSVVAAQDDFFVLSEGGTMWTSMSYVYDAADMNAVGWTLVFDKGASK